MTDMHIGGAWHATRSTDSVPIVDPSTEEVIGQVAEALPEDAHRAVAAAQAAAGPMRRTGAEERAAALDRLADYIEQNAGPFGEAISREMGMPRHLVGEWQIEPAVDLVRGTAKALREFRFESMIESTKVLRVPVGIAVAITPWNYPLLQIAAKIAPAVAAGAPVILKPSESPPLSARLFADAMAGLGLPDGAFGMVTGTGPRVGEYLVRHPAVDMVSLTGSTRAGSRVAGLLAERVARVSLELGGKSACLALPDADMPAAAASALSTVMFNSGQTCTALSRLLVPSKRQDEAGEVLRALAGTYRVGPSTEEVEVGPLANRLQAERVRAAVAAGGTEPVWQYEQERLPAKGYFVAPRVVLARDPSSPLAQEEVFGPVLTVLPYTDEDDAIRIANDPRYGLAGEVWAADEAHGVCVAASLETGMVTVNGAVQSMLAPFGGRKQSGYGREYGHAGIEEFTEIMTIATGG